jgi:hypothetical protein
MKHYSSKYVSRYERHIYHVPIDTNKNVSSSEQGGHPLGPIGVITKTASRNVIFGSLTVITLKITVLWKVTCTVIDIYQLAASIFYLKNGGNRLLQNVGKYLREYTTSRPRRQ